MADQSTSTAVTKLSVVASLVFLFGGSVVQAADEGWYIGTGAGQSRIYDATSCSKLSRDFDPGFSCRKRTTATAARIFGGYRFNPYWSLEAGYIDLGKFAASASGTKSGVPASGSIILKASGLSVDAVGILPITDELGLLGRLGIVRWRTSEASSISVLGVSATEDKSDAGVGLQLGGGLEYDFTHDMKGQAEVIRYPSTTGRSMIDVLLVSILYRFG